MVGRDGGPPARRCPPIHATEFVQSPGGLVQLTRLHYRESGSFRAQSPVHANTRIKQHLSNAAVISRRQGCLLFLLLPGEGPSMYVCDTRRRPN